MYGIPTLVGRSNDLKFVLVGDRMLQLYIESATTLSDNPLNI